MFDEMRKGDKVISVLNDDTDIQEVIAVKQQLEEFQAYKQKTVRSHNKFQAMQVLFWERMMNKHERCETASSRGKSLTTCSCDGKIVIVERPSDHAHDDDDEPVF
jgi:hypothetical protein